MIYIIRLDNGQAVPGTEGPLPQACGNISRPTLAQMIALGWAEYLPPAYDPAVQTLGECVQQGEAWTREVVPRPAAEVRTEALEEIRQIRISSLDAIARSAGVSVVYAENKQAADLILDGQGAEILFDTVTAEQFGTDAGVRLGMTAAEWAAFILGENARERQRGKRIEEGYLRFAYGESASEDAAVLAALPGRYQTFVDALLSAATIEDILAVQEG